MTTQINQPQLAKGLSIVSRAVAARSSLPVLANILIDAQGETASLAASNLEISLRYEVTALVDEPMTITLPAKTLVDMVNTFPADTVSLSLKQTTAALSCGRVKTSIKGIDASEFPRIDRVDLDKAVNIDGATLRGMIRAVLFAVATDGARPVLETVYWRYDAGWLKLATSDGFRVAEVSREVGGAGEACSALIPARAMQHLAAIIDGAETVAVQIVGNRAMFKAGPVELTAYLVEGVFPKYEGIIPRNQPVRATLATRAALDAVKSTDIIAREASHVSRVKIRAGEVEFAAVAAETGDNTATVDADVLGEVNFGSNAKFLIDALGSIGSERVVIEASIPNSPFVLRPEGDEHQFVITMPMFTEGGSK